MYRVAQVESHCRCALIMCKIYRDDNDSDIANNPVDANEADRGLIDS